MNELLSRAFQEALSDYSKFAGAVEIIPLIEFYLD